MKRTLLLIAVFIIALSCFAGCSNKKSSDMDLLDVLYKQLEEKEAMAQNAIEDQKLNYEEEEEKEVPEDIPKKYALMGLKDKSYIPTLTFFEEKGTFSFMFDKFSDDILEGKYKIVDGTLTANTYDDKFHYTFEVIDETSLRFIAGESSEVTLEYKDLGFPVEDQTVFILEEE